MSSTGLVQGSRPTLFQRQQPSTLKSAYQQQKRIENMRLRGALTLWEEQPEPIRPPAHVPKQPTTLTSGSGRRTLSNAELKMYGVSVPTVATPGEQLWNRGELAETGWIIKRGEKPIRKEHRAAALHYEGRWHPGIVGLYSVRQCENIEEHEAKKLARIASWQTSEEEWSGLRQKLAEIRTNRQQSLTMPQTPEQRRTRAGLLYDAGLRKPTVRIYLYLCYLVVLADSNVVTVSDKQIISCCYVDNNVLKSYKTELKRNQLIECKKVNRQAQYRVI